MTRPIETVTDLEWEAYLDEALASIEMAQIEQLLRSDAAARQRCAEIAARRDAGIHSVGEIWRRHRLSCATREQLGSYLLGTLSEEAVTYVQFHLEISSCSYCQANLTDLRNQQAEAAEATQSRRRRYFQSSAGYFKR